MKLFIQILISILTFFGILDLTQRNNTASAQTSALRTSPTSKVPAQRCDRICNSPNWLKMALNQRH